jgi:hypothetical protein
VNPLALAVTMHLNTAVAKAIGRIRAVALLIAGARPVLTVPAKVPYVLHGRLSINGFHGITSKSVRLYRSHTCQLMHGSSDCWFRSMVGERNQADRCQGIDVNQPVSCSHILAVWPMIQLVNRGVTTPRVRRCQQRCIINDQLKWK